MLNSVGSLWISTKYHTLLYLNITYCHTYYDIRILPCVLSVTSYDVRLSGMNLTGVFDKAIKQWRTRLRACVEAKGGHFEQTLKTSSE